MSAQQIITIGRSKGSGGRYVGEQLAERLGIPCYDSEILKKTALKSGFAEQFVKENEEKRPSSFLYSIVMGASRDVQPLQQQLYMFQQQTIQELAEKGPCVFVGRCADYALRDRKNVINCFIHAPMDSRIARTCKRENVSPEEAKAIIQRTDKARSDYSKHFTGWNWGAAHRYHLSIDTSILSISGAVDMIVDFLAAVEKNRSSDNETH